MTQTVERHIKVKDNKGIEHKWLIEAETERTYKIFSNGIITEIYKAGCYTINRRIYSFEIRNNDYPDYTNWFDSIKEDREIDLGYLEDDSYGIDIIYDEEGNAYGL